MMSFVAQVCALFRRPDSRDFALGDLLESQDNCAAMGWELDLLPIRSCKARGAQDSHSHRSHVLSRQKSSVTVMSNCSRLCCGQAEMTRTRQEALPSHVL